MENKESSSLEENLPLVNYIMLHRIYDLLSLIADSICTTEESKSNLLKVIKYHEDGFLLGPSPAYRKDEENDE